jgi:photosystem II stability/assembly factor-like uncharacterized protein
MIRSTDGGVSFIRQAVFTEADISNIKFVDSQTGYAVAGFGPADILKTTNAGQTWVSQIGSYTPALYGIAFVNAQTGYICGTLNIRKTTNGGTNWTNVYTSATSEVFARYLLCQCKYRFAVGSYGTS